VVSWRRTRSFFPVTRELVYLDHAGVAPISTRVEEALRRYTGEATRRGAFDYAVYDDEVERVRQRAALLLGAHRDEIAFVKNTTEGIGLVANGLDWRRGDTVLTCDLEYPSNVTPWQQLRPRGVETVLLPGREGRLPIEDVATALRSPRVRLLALSSVEFGSGARNDLEALGRLCQEHGVLFCVDAIQSLGCLPLDVERCGIDFLSADGHKWLLSVEGCGVFFARRNLLPQLTPPVVGWRNVADPGDFDRYQSELRSDATSCSKWASKPSAGGFSHSPSASSRASERAVPSCRAREANPRRASSRSACPKSPLAAPGSDCAIAASTPW
jgi:selenocysteine lyase/cysteine desulfurase